MKKLKSVVLTVFLILFVTLVAEAPEWEVIPGTQYSMQVYSQVDFMAEYFTNANPQNIVAAFGPGGENDCRAIGYWNEYNQYQLWYMTIVSNAEPEDNELITYKIYDTDSDQVLNCRESSLFTDNIVIGSYDNTFLLTIPYVIDDLYGAYEDSLFTILPASGVLINDEIHLDYLDEFTVVLYDDVDNGVLNFDNDGSFTYQPNLNYFGSDFFEYYATDGVYQTNIAVVEIQVQNVNDAPIIDFQGEGFTFPEDTVYGVDFSPYINDIDNTELVLTHSDNLHVQVDIIDLYVTFTPERNFNGIEDITFTINDNTARLIDSDIVQIEVTPVNDPPVLVSPVDDQNVNEDFLPFDLELNTHFSDPEDDPITYSVDFNENQIGITVNGSILTISSVFNWNDTTQVTVYASDEIPGSAPAVDQFDVIFQPVNDLPFVDVPIDNQSVNEDFDPIVIDLNQHFVDYDDDALSYTVDYDIDLINASIDQNNLTIYSRLNKYGDTEVSVTADDGNRVTVTDTFWVYIAPLNDEPVIALPDSIAFFEDNILIVDFSQYITDVDSEILLLEATGNTNVLIGIVGLMVTFTPAANWNGQELVTFNISDEEFTNSDQVQVIVIPQDEFTIILPSDFTFNEDETKIVDFASYISNPDDFDIQLSSQNADSITVDINELVVTFGANPDWNGQEQITFEVSNINGPETSSDFVDVIVLPVNDLPTVTPIPDQNIMEDSGTHNLDLNSYFDDVDGDILEYSASYENAAISVDIISNMLYFEPETNWNGTTAVIVTAQDGSDRATVEGTFDVIVQPVNDIPEIVTYFTDVTKVEDFVTFQIDFTGYFTDVDEDPLTYSVDFLPEEVNINLIGTVLEISSIPQWFGITTIEVTASDEINRLSVSDQFDLTIQPVNDPPMLILPEEFTFNEDDSLTVDFEEIGYVYDIDTDLADLTLTSAGGESVIIVINGTIVTFSADTNWFGSELIIFTLTDEVRRFVVTDTVTVVVNPLNDEPFFEFAIPDQQVYEGILFDPVDLNYYVTDVDDEDETLIWQYSGNTELLVDIDQLTHIAVVTAPDLDWNGDEDITFTVTDTYMATAFDIVNFQILPVNDAPVVLVPPIPDQFVEINFLDFDIVLSPYFYDVDGDVLTYQVDSNNEQISAVVHGDTLTISSITNWYGESEVIVTADDNVTRASVTDTFLVDVTHTITQMMDLIANWNWISFYVQPEDYSLEYVFSDTLGDNVNTVKYQTETAYYYPEYSGWFGDLEFIQDGGGYLVNVDDPVPGFSLTGNRIMSDTPIEMIADWNWIAYYPPEEDSLSPALTSILDNVQIVKNQDESAYYYPELGGGHWFGDLNVMAPGIGYKVKLANPDVLVYPLYPVVTRERSSHSISMPDNAPEEWNIVPGTSDNMILMLSVEYNNELFDWADDRAMGIFDDDGNCRAHGIWQESSFLEQGFWYFTIVGNTAGDPLYIHLMDENNCESACLDMITFQADTKIGTPFEPFQAVFYPVEEEETEVTPVNVLNQNYPNPFNPETTISFELAAQDFVTINVFNLRGEKIKALVREPREAGSYSVIWDGTDDNGNQVASGIYFYSLNTSQFSATRKMVMIK